MDKIALDLGPLTITWYGLTVACGFLAGLWTASRRALRVGIHSDVIMDLGVWVILGAIAGARIMYVVSYWEQSFAGEPFLSVFRVWEGGLVFYGGLIGSSVATIIFCRLKKLPLWRIADVMAPSVALGHMFGRIGCLMNGCCYGRVCTLPWAIEFPDDHITHGVSVHPTQVYESGLNLLLYLGLVWLFRHRRFEGQVFAVYLFAYAIIRSVVEIFRGDYPEYVAGIITPAHWISFGLLVIGGTLFVTQSKRGKLTETSSDPA